MKLKIFKNEMDLPDLVRSSAEGLSLDSDHAISIGNFDGYHLGHQALIANILAKSEQSNLKSMVVSFSPRPEDYFRSSHESQNLFSASQKARALNELGVDTFVSQKFNQTFAQLSHEGFYHRYLFEYLHAKYISIGENFCFGFKRQGNSLWLKQTAAADGVDVEIAKPVLHRDEIISSTRIRGLIHREGAVAEASRMLGRPFMMEGTIAQGNQIGRTIGVPTANLSGVEQLIAKSGVYCGYVWLGERGELCPTVMHLPKNKIPAVFNIGLRPTVNQNKKEIRVEAHLLQGEYGINDLYGSSAAFFLVDRLRDEMRFPELADLKNQINKDIAQSQKTLGC